MKCTYGKLWESRKHQEDFRSNLTCILNDKKKVNRKGKIEKIRHRGPRCAVNNGSRPPRAMEARIIWQMHGVNDIDEDSILLALHGKRDRKKSARMLQERLEKGLSG